MFNNENLRLNKSYTKMSPFLLVTSYRSVVPTAESNKLQCWNAVKTHLERRLRRITSTLIGKYLSNFDFHIGKYGAIVNIYNLKVLCVALTSNPIIKWQAYEYDDYTAR